MTRLEAMVTKKVLLVDDEEGILSLVSATLGDDDRYGILLAGDGEEALAIARTEKPDVVFLDIMMPKMNGFEVCRQLKSDPATSSIVVVMLTAVAQDADRCRDQQVGADDYFTKPFSPTALLDKVEEVLGLG